MSGRDPLSLTSEPQSVRSSYRIVEYDLQWPVLYQDENARIVEALAIDPERYPQKVCKQSGVYLLSEQHGSRPKRGDRPPMRKESTESRSESRPEWEQLEDWVRGHVQRLIQELL